MKNLILPFALFIIMVFCILFSVNILNAKCLELQKYNIALEEYVNTENWRAAENTSQEFLDSWKEDSKKLSLYIHHAEIDNIHMEMFKLTQYIKCKNKDESLASIHALKFLLNHIADLEKLSAQNIF